MIVVPRNSKGACGAKLQDSLSLCADLFLLDWDLGF